MTEHGTRNDRPRLLISGYYGYANTGDEAILTTMLRDLRARRRDLEFIVVSGDPEQTAATYGVRAIAANDIPAILDAAQASKPCSVAGGSFTYWGAVGLLLNGHTAIFVFAGSAARG